MRTCTQRWPSLRASSHSRYTQKTVSGASAAFISDSSDAMMRTRSRRQRMSASSDSTSKVLFIAARSVLNIMSVATRM